MQRVRKQVSVHTIAQKTIKENISVAVLDSGVGQHPDLFGRVAAFRDFVHGKRYPYDDSGHGTHVCGIICGSGKASAGKYCGMAPAAQLVVGKVLDSRGDGSTEQMLEGLNWVLQLRKEYSIRILNISVGTTELPGESKRERLKEKLNQIWEEGITVVCAAGNQGPDPGTISALAEGSRVICVGCHDGEYYRELRGRCDSYCSRGVPYALPRKPDIVAPGTNIISCSNRYPRELYTAKSGTSMATPIVSGAIALGLLQEPMLTNEQIKHRLTATATDLGEAWNKQGWGMLNVEAFLNHDRMEKIESKK
ncbi:MAG: S8 family peptidase [Roseburia sp.]|nr:S8 family peptidase [Roseburia sp.]